MKYKTILFDLDGTLTDSGEGIINCAILALKHFGIPVSDRNTMRAFIGPPLHEMFLKFGVPADEVDTAVSLFRSRYHTVGKFENHPYPGIDEMLDALSKKGYKLLVATSKPETLSKEIMDNFNLSKYFIRIYGATLDCSRITKSDVIAYLLENYQSDGQMIMVGDTAFDVTGAAAHGIPTVGVSWGYGNTEEMLHAGALAIAHSIQELQDFLMQ